MTATTNIFDSTYLQVHVDVYDPVMRKLTARLSPAYIVLHCQRMKSVGVSLKRTAFVMSPMVVFQCIETCQVNYENKTLKNVILFGNSLSSYVTHVSMFNSRSVDNDTKSFIATFSSSIMPYMDEYVIHRNKMASTLLMVLVMSEERKESTMQYRSQIHKRLRSCAGRENGTSIQ